MDTNLLQINFRNQPISPQFALKRSLSKKNIEVSTGFQLKLKEISPRGNNGSLSRRGHNSPLLRQNSSHGLKLQRESSQSSQSKGNNKAFGQIFSYFIKRNEFKTNLFNINGFNDQSHIHVKDEIKERLQSVKNHGMMFDNMPSINYDEGENGWKSIYLGILSPYSNKFQRYVEEAIKKAKEEQSQGQQGAIEEKIRTFKRSITNNGGGGHINRGQNAPQQAKNNPIWQKNNRTQQTHLRTMEDKKSSLSLLKSNSLRSNVVEEKPKNTLEEIFKLSDFKKSKLVNELINGKLSRSSMEYKNLMMKVEENDYMKILFKKLLIKKALKNNFDAVIGVSNSKRELSKIKDQKDKLIFKSMTVEAIDKIQKKIQRAGLDPTNPHFQLDWEKFTYVDFENCISKQISDQINSNHNHQIKKQKLRNAKSMVDFRIQVEYDDKEEELDEFENKEKAEEKQNFIDAHYLNRRKSCQCTCCGGLDSEPIRKMDKTAMDQLKLGISHLLKQKLIDQKSNKFGLKRQRLGKLDDNDGVMGQKRFSLNFNGKRRQGINGQNIGMGRNSASNKRNSGSGLSHFPQGRNRIQSIPVRFEEPGAIITIDELNKFGGIPQAIDTKHDYRDIQVSNFFNRIKDIQKINDDDDESEIEISLISSLQTSYDSKEEEEIKASLKQKSQTKSQYPTSNKNQKHNNLNAFSSYFEKLDQKDKQIDNSARQRNKMRIFFNQKGSFKIQKFQQISKQSIPIQNFKDNAIKLNKDLNDVSKNQQQDLPAEYSKQEVQKLLEKFNKNIKKVEIQKEIDLTSRPNTKSMYLRSNSVKYIDSIRLRNPKQTYLNIQDENKVIENIKSKKSKSKSKSKKDYPILMHKFPGSTSNSSIQNNRLTTATTFSKPVSRNFQRGFEMPISSSNYTYELYNTADNDFFTKRQNLQSQNIKKRPLMMNQFSQQANKFKTIYSCWNDIQKKQFQDSSKNIHQVPDDQSKSQIQSQDK
ncbi:UNKNOWN [Stylonychia lemnae]|uniref:Uncharacterized protein n=1 Tax=Stylonychia lemnae TaxID=5949 RepID=A0A078B7C0_STYLE|nr:UNKNOWN [Stylonychia lemnae]|eukprot:CDW90309.1 UNKNOWN [Stylonychia lemnae]